MSIEVAITLVRKEDQFLLVYSDAWGAYTLPMTKRKAPDKDLSDDSEIEDWLDAAARPVVECLGRLNSPEQILEDFLPEEHFSRRRRSHIVYKYKVFQVFFQSGDEIAVRTPTAWLTSDEIRGGTLRPISPTAVEVMSYLEELGGLRL